MKYSKEIYAKLADSYLTFSLLRNFILISIVLTLYNSFRSDDFKQTMRDFEQVKSLGSQSLGIPITNNWVINNMSKEHGIFDEDKIKAMLKSRAIQSHERNDINPSEIDTLAINKIIHLQDSLLRKMDKQINTDFSLNVSFLGSSKVDIQYWIFLLPIIYLMALIHILILNKKIAIVKSFLVNCEPEQKIEAFDNYPFVFLRKVLLMVEFLAVCFFVYTYWYLLELIPGFSFQLLFLIGLSIYFSIVLYLCIELKLLQSGGETGLFLHVVMRIYSFLRLCLSKLMWPKLTWRYNLSGTFLIFSTLFLFMSQRGCNWEDEPQRKDFLHYKQGSWHKTQIPEEEDSGPIAYSGWELVKNFPDKVWEFGKDNVLLNRVIQVCYVLTIANTSLLLLIVLSRVLRKTRVYTNAMIHYGFISTSLSYLIFSSYYLTQEFNLYFRVAFTFMIVVGWLYLSFKHLRYSSLVDYKYVLKLNLLFTLPSIFIFVSFSVYFIYAGLPELILKSDSFLFMVFIIGLLMPWIFLPVGLFIHMIGLYKIRRLHQ